MYPIYSKLTFLLFELLLPLTRFRLTDLDRLSPYCHDLVGSEYQEKTAMPNVIVRRSKSVKTDEYFALPQANECTRVQNKSADRAVDTSIKDRQKVTIRVELDRDRREADRQSVSK